MALKNGFYQLVTEKSVTMEYYLCYHNKVYSCCCGELTFDDGCEWLKRLKKSGFGLRYSNTLPNQFKPGLDKINQLLGTNFTLKKY